VSRNCNKWEVERGWDVSSVYILKGREMCVEDVMKVLVLFGPIILYENGKVMW
jgi:hypothetical protein